MERRDCAICKSLASLEPEIKYAALLVLGVTHRIWVVDEPRESVGFEIGQGLAGLVRSPTVWRR